MTLVKYLPPIRAHGIAHSLPAPEAMNAIADALWRAYRVEHIDMPATPFAVYGAIRRSSAGP